MRLAILGSGGLGRVVAESILRSGDHELLGFIDDNPQAPSNILGFDLLGKSADLPLLIKTKQLQGVFIAIGSNNARYKVCARISEENPQLKFPEIIDAAATVSPSAKISDGCLIACGAIIGPGAELGKFCIINTAAVIEHDAKLSSYCYVGPKALVDSRANLTEAASLAGGQIVAQNKVFDGRDIYD